MRSSIRRPHLLATVLGVLLGVLVVSAASAHRARAAAPRGQFRVNGDGTVADAKTGLVWQQTPDGQKRSWDEARAYCTQLGLAGGRWRLPTPLELQSLVDVRRAGPAYDTEVFPAIAAELFWSSAPLVGEATFAWGVNIAAGTSVMGGMAELHAARCVR